MIKKDLIDLLKLEGLENISDALIRECRVDKQADGTPFYPRNNLLFIFRRRLKGCRLYDKNNQMIPFLEKAIEKLEKISESEVIFHWQVQSHGKRISGRSTKEQILHIYPSDEYIENVEQ